MEADSSESGGLLNEPVHEISNNVVCASPPITHYQGVHDLDIFIGSGIFYPRIRYANDLILIFMNIYENMRNKRKMVEK